MLKCSQKIIMLTATLASKKIINPSSNSEVAVNPIFNAMMANMRSLIGENMELQNLIGKNISVGKRLFTHPIFLSHLKENSLFKN